MQIASPIEEDEDEDEDEEDEEEEVEVIEVDKLTLQLMELEFGALDTLVAEIRAIPPPITPRRRARTVEETIPDILALEGIIRELDQLKLATLPKKKLRTNLTFLACNYCQANFRPGTLLLILSSLPASRAHSSLRCARGGVSRGSRQALSCRSPPLREMCDRRVGRRISTT
jgi:hypothetical protein